MIRALASLVEVNALAEDGQILATGPGIPVAKGWILCEAAIHGKALLLEIRHEKHRWVLREEPHPAAEGWVWLHAPDIGVPSVTPQNEPPPAGIAIFGAKGRTYGEWAHTSNGTVAGIIKKGQGPIPNVHASFQTEERWPWGFIRGEWFKGRGVPVFAKDGGWVGLQRVQRIAADESRTGINPIVLASSLRVPKGAPLRSGPGVISEESALNLLERSQWDLLEGLVRKWQSTVPGDPAAWFYLGRCHTVRGLQAEAIASYLKALEALPEDPMVWTSLAKSQARNLDFEGASASLERALTLRPGLFYQPREMIRILHILGEHDRELSWERRCPRMEPPPPPGGAYDRIANWFERHGRWEEALTIWKERLHDGEQWAIPRIVQCLHKAGRHEDEPIYLRQMSPGEGNPMEEDRVTLECILEAEHHAGLAAEERLGAWSSNPPKSPAILVNQLINHRNHESVGYLLNAPGMVNYDWTFHLEELVGSGMLDEAILVLNRKPPVEAFPAQASDFKDEASPNQSDAWQPSAEVVLNLIRGLKRQGRFAEAKDVFQASVNPDDSLEFGFALLELKMITQAESVFQRILKIRPDASAWLGLGLAAEGRGAPQTALAHFKQASKTHTNRESMFSLSGNITALAEAFLRNGFPNEAEDLLRGRRDFSHGAFTPTFEGDDATRTVGEDDESRALLSQVLDVEQIPHAAILEAREYLGFHYHDEPMWLRLGRLYLKKGESAEAQTCLNRLKALRSSKAAELEAELNKIEEKHS